MKNWQNQFTTEHLKIAADRFHTDVDRIEKIGGFENLVYQMPLNGESAILRVTHEDHRKREEFEAEMYFMRHLAAEGVNVCQPIQSPQGHLLEEIDDGFILTAFEKARGEHVRLGHPDWGPSLFHSWGRVTGMMHTAAQSFELPAGARRNEAEDALSSYRVGQPDERLAEVQRKLDACEQAIRALPRDANQYGLCHRDLHPGNFFVHNGVMQVIDFDDCGYDHFAHDIAIAVYYASTFADWKQPAASQLQSTERADRFLPLFMEGYMQTYTADPSWLKQLPLFIEKRRCELLYILMNEWGSDQLVNPSQRDWIEWNFAGIIRDEPCMEPAVLRELGR